MTDLIGLVLFSFLISSFLSFQKLQFLYLATFYYSGIRIRFESPIKPKRSKGHLSVDSKLEETGKPP